MIVPDVFHDAAIAELTSTGYYRTDPKIEIQVDGNFISFACTSRIVKFNGVASVVPPKAAPAKGLKIVDKIYEIDGNEVKGAVDIKDDVSDRYFVKFKKTGQQVKEISDTHYWLSPVTAFTVTFIYAKTHSCGVEKLTGRRVDLAPEPNTGRSSGRSVFKYPCASFSGQGFNWWVKWRT